MGATCTYCKSPVPSTSLGKYCVRFGMDVHQFCLGRCLDNFKKGLKDCLASYEKINGLKQRKQNCSVCDVQTDNIVLVTHKNLEYRLCGDLCIASFRHKNKLTSSICDTCSSFFKPQKEKNFYLCTLPGPGEESVFQELHESLCAEPQEDHALQLVQGEEASVPASVSQMITCEQCSNTGPAQYHLTMSDASMRNFCSYPCVLAFQSKYSGQQQPSPATPVISSVRSLAQNNSPVIAAPSKIIREVLIKPNPPKILKNKSTLCKPIMQSKSSTCKPSISHKASQTVPIFMPVPVHMFNRAVPTPFPFPVPQPVPIFLPTTQRTQQQILAKIKELAEELSKGAAAEEAGKRKPEDTPEEEPEAKVPKLEVVEEEEEEVDLMEHRDKMFQKLQSSYGVSTFQCWLKTKLGQVGDNCSDDLLALEPAELASYLHLFAKELRRPRTQEIYPADIIYYLCLGIQAHLTQHGRADKIFVDDPYRTFNVGLTEALRESTLKTEPKELLVREEMLWESMELGAHSPQVLLTTLLYFATKGFGCRSPPDHARLTFSTVLKRRHRGQLYLAYLLPLKGIYTSLQSLHFYYLVILATHCYEDPVLQWTGFIT
ncbi:hypothetical protein LAZ67_5000008 [Cordylochernes scorpioides]|uniref:TRASH domain-containing protein n=1 Tax=Cordylochernes scorpioides TaxID=51811 RepID=A0ABY6KI08_9ARAC|nr:hypothetical protein LAZ67_5000008 [Cordylochernes scorpioides]